MRADFARSPAVKVADELECFRRAADRVIEDESWPYAKSLEYPLRPILAPDRAYTAGAPRPRASQSNSASVSTTTTSIGACSAGQVIVVQVAGSSMLYQRQPAACHGADDLQPACCKQPIKIAAVSKKSFRW